jgi:hypothetical protein
MQRLRHGGQQLLPVEWFSKKTGNALGATLVRDFMASGNEKNRQVRPHGTCSIPEFKAVDARQSYVRNQNIDVG